MGEIDAHECLDQIPIIDLFAGPGGLGEGFARYPIETKKRFKVVLSIEKDPDAHKTLTLRAFFRQFDQSSVPLEYYQYLRGETTKEALFDSFPVQATAAQDEARLLELGKEDPHELIRRKLRGSERWVLIGGPPCQAYSLVGRSKMLGDIKRNPGESLEQFNLRRTKAFDKDHRHQLYRHYLEIIAMHWPSIFVMENVRGILSAKHNGERIFPKILRDLGSPADVFPGSGRKHEYRIYSLTTPPNRSPIEQDPADFLIRSELYGVPQARHRVILVGVRDDFDSGQIPLLQTCEPRTVRQSIGDLPNLTSGVSKANGLIPYHALSSLSYEDLHEGANGASIDAKLEKLIRKVIRNAHRSEQRGSVFLPNDDVSCDVWYHDPRLGGVCNHETRRHIKEDLWRYVFASCYAEHYGVSPQLRDFPKALLPNHANVMEAIEGQKFGDRFRVQVADKPSSTITSHISKDGHYFIHYDPLQYRSLTVREAARLQTFPDNYFFEGNRTSQYHQVGNAVPPLLAYYIAGIVDELFGRIKTQ